MTTLLLVEDNELNRDMLSRRLKRMNFTVIMAENGQEGVEMAKSDQPSLILMDINMPVMDGWEAILALRADPQTQNIPVIALTAHAMTTDKDKVEEFGFDGYATKPVDFPELIRMIEKQLT